MSDINPPQAGQPGQPAPRPIQPASPQIQPRPMPQIQSPKIVPFGQKPPVPGQLIQPPARKEVDANAPISLVDEPTGGGAPAPSKIRAMGVAGAHQSHFNLKRIPFLTGQGAIRVRSFHGRLSEEGLAFLDDKINEWLDNHPEIEVKFVTNSIGQFEGKLKEPALVLNVWY